MQGQPWRSVFISSILFTGEETDVARALVTCQGTQSCRVQNQDLNPGHLRPEFVPLSLPAMSLGLGVTNK